MEPLELAAVLALGVFLKRSPTENLQAWRAGQKVSVDLVPVDQAGHLMARDAAMAFANMREVAAGAGVRLVVDSAFRTWDQQAALYSAYQRGERTDPVAPPGYSNHQAGDAVDVVTERGTNDAYRWLERNAHLYKFARTVSSEPWHWEFMR